MVPESVLVGASGGRAAILGGLPEKSTTADEVHAFVESLLENEAIAFEGAKSAAETRRTTPAETPVSPRSTHAVRTRGGKKFLVRTGFVCCHTGEPPNADPSYRDNSGFIGGGGTFV